MVAWEVPWRVVMDDISWSTGAVFLRGSMRISRTFSRSRATGRVHQRNESIRRRWHDLAVFCTARSPTTTSHAPLYPRSKGTTRREDIPRTPQPRGCDALCHVLRRWKSNNRPTWHRDGTCIMGMSTVPIGLLFLATSGGRRSTEEVRPGI